MKFLRRYKDALDKAPDNPDVQTSLGLMLFDRGQFVQARQAFDRAVANGTDNADVLFYAALARFRAKKPFQFKINEAKEILEVLDSSIMMNPLPQYFYAKAHVIETLIEKKHISYPETSAVVRQEAQDAHLTEADIIDTNQILGI